MTRYVAENCSLRAENRQLHSLESVMKAKEVLAQVSSELEDSFQRAMESERLSDSKMIRFENWKKMSDENCLSMVSCCSTAPSAYSTLMAADSAATIEKLKAQVLQKQSDVAAVLQAFEEYKEVTK